MSSDGFLCRFFSGRFGLCLDFCGIFVVVGLSVWVSMIFLLKVFSETFFKLFSEVVLQNRL